MEKTKYHPKIEMVKYLELIGQNKIWPILTLSQKCANFPASHKVIQFLIFFYSNLRFIKFRH